MKRDVKVGLFVAAVVCCVAALLLGGGIVGRPRARAVPLRVGVPEDRPGALPAELAAAAVPPPEVEGRAEEFAESVEVAGETVSDSEPADDSLVDDDPLSDALLDLGALLEEDPTGTAEVIAERPAGLLQAGPSASGPAAAEALEPVDMDEEDLLALELAEADAALEAPAEPVELAGDPDVAFEEIPRLLIAAPSRRIAVPAPAKHVYIMKKGDSFWSVAKEIYGAAKHFDDIRRANPDVEPRKLRPKDVIAVPEIPGVRMRKDLLADPAELESRRKPRVYLAQDRIHEVQSGETLQHISLNYYGYMSKWPHIVKANPDLDPRRIRPGDKIVVPALTE